MRNALRQRLRALAIADDRRSGSLSITFDRAFPGFDGHFAEQSIVPGLCFIQLAVILAEEIRSQPTRLAEIIRLKSLKPIRPEESVTLALTRRNGRWQAITTTPAGETVCQLLFTVKDA
ncbi:MAG TPA: hypothetical protein PKY10_07640 [Lentisphaeria bacterium]|nr:hypothetical protein [Lentisphaeria bacterium]